MVSPRITIPLSERLGLGSVGSTTEDLAKTGAASVPVDTSLSRDELAALGLLELWVMFLLVWML